MSIISAKKVLKSMIPDGLLDFYYRVSGKTIRFTGVYPSWQEAKRNSAGYESEEILQNVIKKTKLVESGEYFYERDGVVFEKADYPFPLVALLLRAAIENNNKLSILDFGGALGSAYFQCRNFLPDSINLSWSVVEQEHFVIAGNSNFANQSLRFHSTLDESCSYKKPNVVIFSGVLQYLPDPLFILNLTVASGAEYIVIDRTPFIEGKETILSLQKVPKKIIESSYPVWLFNMQELRQILSKKYTEITTFDAIDGVIGYGQLKANFQGMIFKLDPKNNATTIQ